MSTCDAENELSIISAKACTISVSVLRSPPFNLGDSEPISARVTAINDIGESPVSTEGSATMPIADVEPDAPFVFERHDGLTTKT